MVNDREKTAYLNFTEELFTNASSCLPDMLSFVNGLKAFFKHFGY